MYSKYIYIFFKLSDPFPQKLINEIFKMNFGVKNIRIKYFKIYF